VILVLLGTFNIEFQRPLKAIEHFVANNPIEEEIIVQSGYTNFHSKYFTIIPFMAPAVLDDLYNKASLIITHAGTGSILQGVKKGKKVIAIARLKKYKEHIDDHQLEILKEFVGCNYILSWDQIDSFETVLKKSKTFIPTPYNSDKKNLVNFLINYIEDIK